MKRSHLTIAGLGFAVVVLTAVAIVLALPASATTPDESRALTVIGSGAVTAAPDVAKWSFGVETDGATAGDALRANSGAIQNVLDALAGAGVAAGDLRTEQVSVFQAHGEERFEDGAESGAIGFTATNSVRATIRAVSESGALIDAAVAAGANQVFGPSLSVSSIETKYAEALELAFDDAREKAERLATHAGLSIGEALVIEEAGGSPIVVAAQDGVEEDAPVSPGQSRVEASLTVSFAVS